MNPDHPADQFRSYISLLLNDKKLHKKMSDESRKFASEFTWDKQTCRTKEFFESDILMIRQPVFKSGR